MPGHLNAGSIIGNKCPGFYMVFNQHCNVVQFWGMGKMKWKMTAITFLESSSAK